MDWTRPRARPSGIPPPTGTPARSCVLRSKPQHHFIVGGTLFLFWTREPVGTEDVMTLFEPTAEQLRHLLVGVKKGEESNAIEDVNDFYLLAVSGNSARAVVRDYLEEPLGKVRESIRRWFADLSITDTSQKYRGQNNAAFSLRVLADATGVESPKVAAAIHVELMAAAIDSTRPLSDGLLAACLGRIRADQGGKLWASRAALVKVCLLRRGIAMTSVLEPNGQTYPPAYLYGRLLSLLDQIQNAALGDVNATVVDKYFRTMSVRPRTIAPRLIGYAQAHLRKMRVDPTKKGTSIWLDQRLTSLVNQLPLDTAAESLPICDQGLFVMGFYHQQAERYTPKDD